MSGGLYGRATEIAVLAAGRLPEWTKLERSAVLLDLPGGADGVATQSRMVTHVALDLRATLGGRRFFVSVATLDLTATYTVTIDGTACAYDAAADGAASLADVLAGIAAEITSTASALVSATVDDDAEEVVLTSVSAEGAAVTAFAATGTGALAVEAEPQAADLEVYGQLVGLEGWRLMEFVEVGRKGYADAMKTAGWSRIAARVANQTGAPTDAAGVTLAPARLAIGPAKQETAA